MTCARAAIILLAAATAAAGQQPSGTGTYTLVQNGIIIATESFERADDRLQARLEILNQATLRIDATLRPDATIGRLEVEVFGPGPVAGEPIQSSAVVFDDGTATFEQPIGTPAGQPSDVRPGALPFVNPSPSFMEQILRRARAMGGAPATVPIWVPTPTGGQVSDAVVAFEDGAATITFGGVRIEAATDDAGRLLAARVPSQGLVIERR